MFTPFFLTYPPLPPASSRPYPTHARHYHLRQRTTNDFQLPTTAFVVNLDFVSWKVQNFQQKRLAGGLTFVQPSTVPFHALPASAIVVDWSISIRRLFKQALKNSSNIFHFNKKPFVVELKPRTAITTHFLLQSMPKCRGWYTRTILTGNTHRLLIEAGAIAGNTPERTKYTSLANARNICPGIETLPGPVSPWVKAHTTILDV